MRSELALCPHLAAMAVGAVAFTLAPDEILEFDGGPVEAVVRCRSCGACGWLQLVDREPSAGLRIFALAALRADDVALYFRNRARGSCDVARGRAELEALVACAGPFERVLALDCEALRIEAVAQHPPDAGAGADGRWLERLGLTKAVPD